MAFTLGEAIVYISADDKDLKSGLGGAKSKLSSFGGVATKVLGGVVVAGAAAAAAAIFAIGKGALDVSSQTAQASADIAASLGLPIAEAERLGDVARKVFGDNFADSVNEAGDAIIVLVQQLGFAADDPSLQTMAENAFKLRDVFDVDVRDSVSAVKTLMENFGLTADEAFDLVAAGFQKGLNRSGDFIDTIEEYSVQFGDAGATADEFFSLLESGLQGGMLGTDKAADAFKEFTVRIVDGSKTTKAGLESIGLSAAEMEAAIASGQMTVADVFQLVIDKLRDTEDPIARNQAGVALLGTQYEDLTDSVATQLDTTLEWAKKSEGAIDSLDAKYATLGDAVSAIWRRLTTSIAPFTDALLDLVNNTMPTVMKAFDRFDDSVGSAMKAIGDAIAKAVDWIRDKFKQARESTGETQDTLQYLKQWFDDNMPRIQAIVQRVVDAMTRFWAEHGDKIMWIVDVVLVSLLRAVDTTLKNILDIVTFWLAILNGDWDAAGNALQRITERTWNSIKATIEDALNSLVSIVFGVGQRMYDAGAGIVNRLKDGILGTFNSLINEARNKLNELTALLPGSEPKDPRSPLRNLQKRGEAIMRNIQAGMDNMNLNIDQSVGGFAGRPSVNNNNNFNVHVTSTGSAVADIESRLQLYRMIYG